MGKKYLFILSLKQKSKSTKISPDFSNRWKGHKGNRNDTVKWLALYFLTFKFDISPFVLTAKTAESLQVATSPC